MAHLPAGPSGIFGPLSDVDELDACMRRNVVVRLQSRVVHVLGYEVPEGDRHPVCNNDNR